MSKKIKLKNKIIFENIVFSSDLDIEGIKELRKALLKNIYENIEKIKEIYIELFKDKKTIKKIIIELKDIK